MHAIRLGVVARDQIVDQHADVRLVASEYQGRLLPRGTSRIDPRDQSLRRRLLIARGAVHLAGQEQPREGFALQGGGRLVRRHVVVLHRVAGAEDHRLLEARNRAQHRQLHILRQASVRALHVHLVGVPALRLQEQLVALLVGEAHDLVLDRGAVARTDALDRAIEHRCPVQVVANDPVRLRGGVDQRAGQLVPPGGGTGGELGGARARLGVAPEATGTAGIAGQALAPGLPPLIAEEEGDLAAGLIGGARIVDAAAVDARRCPRLEPAKLQAEAAKCPAQA